MRCKRRKSRRRRNPKLKHMIPLVLLAGGAVVVYLMLTKKDTKGFVVNDPGAPDVPYMTESGAVFNINTVPTSVFIGPSMSI